MIRQKSNLKDFINWHHQKRSNPRPFCYHISLSLSTPACQHCQISELIMSFLRAWATTTDDSKSSFSSHTVIKVPVADDATSVHWSPVVSDELWSFEDSSVVQQASVNEMILRQAGQINRDAISANERLFIALWLRTIRTQNYTVNRAWTMDI